MKIRITADSSCDLPQKLLQKYNIEVPAGYIINEHGSFKDMVNIFPEDLYAYFQETGKLCTTSAVNIVDYEELFGKLLENADAVIHFTHSSTMTSCYQNACIASESFAGHVFVVDSMSLTNGVGLLAITAAELAEEGSMTAEEIAEYTRIQRSKLSVSFVIDTLDYLKAGGRCSSVAALGANLLGLKPCIMLQDGNMSVGKKYRGKIEKCYEQYLADQLKDREDIDTRRAFIVDSGGISDELRAHLKELVYSYQPFEELHLAQAGCTISQHCGPGAMGVVFYQK